MESYLGKLLGEFLGQLHSLVLDLEATQVHGISSNVATRRRGVTVLDLPRFSRELLEGARLGSIERDLLVLCVCLAEDVLGELGRPDLDS